MKFRAIILDFDGLVLDSETPLFDIWADIYSTHGQQLSLDDWQHALGTQGGFDPYEELVRRTEQAIDHASLVGTSAANTGVSVARNLCCLACGTGWQRPERSGSARRSPPAARRRGCGRGWIVTTSAL